MFDWVGGWVGWVEEGQAVGMLWVMVWVGGWVGGMRRTGLIRVD